MKMQIALESLITIQFVGFIVCESVVPQGNTGGNEPGFVNSVECYC